MNCIKKIQITVLLVLIFSGNVFAKEFLPKTEFQVCFTPYQNCTAEIIHVIDAAKKSIYMQAYSFTSRPIARALIDAKRRGVKVSVILDKSQFMPDHYSAARSLIKRGISVWNDDGLDIAHNKVIIVDESVVETGSFNYTNSAQHYNAENVLIIYSKALAQAYLNNWIRRERVSRRVEH